MRIKIFGLAAFLALAFGFYFQADIVRWYSGAARQIHESTTEVERAVVESLVGTLREQVKLEVSAPPPLRVPDKPKNVPAPRLALSAGGTIGATNARRTEGGLPPLQENALLAGAAAAKARDMLEQQYFDHISPSGAGPADLVRRTGYDFLAVGENLALGDFDDDTDLVQAWMDSPGHRANILSKKYAEIGAAVLKGVFEGREVWFAVQEFGLPASVCPEPDQPLKAKIEDAQTRIDMLAALLQEKRAELEELKARRDPDYNRQAAEYNELVRQYNGLIEDTRALVASYNRNVLDFNTCIGGFKS